MRKLFICLSLFAIAAILATAGNGVDKYSAKKEAVAYSAIDGNTHANFSLENFAVLPLIDMVVERPFKLIKHEATTLIESYVSAYVVRCRPPPKIV